MTVPLCGWVVGSSGALGTQGKSESRSLAPPTPSLRDGAPKREARDDNFILKEKQVPPLRYAPVGMTSLLLRRLFVFLWEDVVEEVAAEG